MSQFYPQGVMVINVLWEDYKRGSARDSKAGTYTVDLIPKQMTVSINDYRTADTFSCELDYRNFPFDPRTIRSIQVSIYMEDMRYLRDAGDGIKAKGLAKGRVSVGSAADLVEFVSTRGTSNVIFSGFADEATLEFDEDDRTVKFSGRDLTSVLIDTRWDGSLVNLDALSLETVIKKILLKLDSTKDIELVNRSRSPLPLMGQIPGGFGETPDPTADGKLKNKRNSKQQETYWDVIQDLVIRSGLIAYIEIDKLIVTKPNALYKDEDSKIFVYGRNLLELDFKRKIGRFKDLNLKLISLNPRLSPPVVEVTIPKDASIAFKRRLKLPDGDIMIEKLKADGTKEEEPQPAPFTSFNIPKVPSKKRLIEIGENIFEEMSRQQIEGGLKTREMAVRNKAGSPFDLTKLRIGTPIDIRIDNDDLVGMRDVDSFESRNLYLLKRGYKSPVAQVLAEIFTGFETPFYTKSVEFTLDGEKGFECKINFINFISLKEDLLR